MAIHYQGLAPLLQVFDMPASLCFYRDWLGFTVVAQSSPGDTCNWCLLRYENAELMLNTAYESAHRPAQPDPARIAAHSDTTLYFGCQDLDAAHAHLESKGIAANPPVTRPYGMRQLSFADPDGYHICLQWPSAGNDWP